MIERREDMIADTNRFLSWALKQEGRLPRIQRRRVDAGGFTALLREPGVRQSIELWWLRVLADINLK